MSRKWCIGLVALLAVMLCFAFVTASVAEKDDDDQKVTLDQCPTAVQDTLKEQAKGGTIGEIEKENEDGKVIYSAEITKDGKKYDVEVAEDGKLIQSKVDDDDDESGKEETGDNEDEDEGGETD